jgi:hypothetical protein
VRDNLVEIPGQGPIAAYQDNGIQVGYSAGEVIGNAIIDAPANGLIVLTQGDNRIVSNVIIRSGVIAHVHRQSPFQPRKHRQWLITGRPGIRDLQKHHQGFRHGSERAHRTQPGRHPSLRLGGSCQHRPQQPGHWRTGCELSGYGDALVYAVVSGPLHGTLSGSDVTRTYTPMANFAGADSFTFTVVGPAPSRLCLQVWVSALLAAVHPGVATASIAVVVAESRVERMSRTDSRLAVPHDGYIRRHPAGIRWVS